MRLTPWELLLVAVVLVVSIRVLVAYGDRTEDQKHIDSMARKDTHA